MTAVRDGLLYRALPLFNGCLAFLPACTSPSDSPLDTNGTDASDSSTTNDPDTTLTTAPAETSEGSTSAEGSSGDSLDSTETGEPAGCAEGSMCGAEPPEGWFGPTIIARVPHGEASPACPEEYPTPGQDMFDGFSDPPDALCECTCEPPAAPSCNANLRVHGPNSCYGYAAFINLTSTCQNFEADGFSDFHVYGGGYYYYYNPAECTASTTAEIPPVTWESTISTCRLSETPLTCSNGTVCIPPAPADFEATWCIYQQGDAGCPAGVFNTKSVFHTGATDDRECSDCTCGTPADLCQEAELLLFSDIDCAGEPDVVLEANGGCQDIDASSFAMDFPSASSCPVATPPHSMGTAEPTGEFTFCCVG